MDHKLDLIGHDGYDAKIIGHANDDFMRAVYGAPSFPFIESLRSSNRLMIFKEILSYHVDKDEDNQRLNDEGLVNTMDPIALWLFLAGQPLSLFEEPSLPSLCSQNLN